jgi:hypothetical protein
LGARATKEVANAHSIRHRRERGDGGTKHTTAGSQSLFVLLAQLYVDLPHTRWQKKGCINANKISTHESELEKSFDAWRRTNKLIWLDTA